MNDAGAQGKVSAEVRGKRGFPGVAYTPEAKLAPRHRGKDRGPELASNLADEGSLIYKASW